MDAWAKGPSGHHHSGGGGGGWHRGGGYYPGFGIGVGFGYPYAPSYGYGLGYPAYSYYTPYYSPPLYLPANPPVLPDLMPPAAPIRLEVKVSDPETKVWIDGRATTSTVRRIPFRIWKSDILKPAIFLSRPGAPSAALSDFASATTAAGPKPTACWR